MSAIKYFTCDLLERYACFDEEVAEQAEKEWEDRSLQYVAKVDGFRRELPPDFQRLETSYCLHDAKVVHCEVIGRFAFLRLTLVDKTDLAMAYQLTSESAIQLKLDRTDHYWLYDEVAKQKTGQPATFLHSILLADTADAVIEVNIRFNAFWTEHCSDQADFGRFKEKISASLPCDSVFPSSDSDELTGINE